MSPYMYVGALVMKQIWTVFGTELTTNAKIMHKGLDPDLYGLCKLIDY